MNRPWHVLLLYLTCLTVVLVAMIWLTVRSLQLDRAEAQAREELQQEIDIKLAVLRMDAVLAPLLAQEAAISHEGFSSVSDGRLVAPDTMHGQASTPSAEGASESPPHVYLNFQCADGRWSSPQVADEQAAETSDMSSDPFSLRADVPPTDSRETSEGADSAEGQGGDTNALVDKLRQLSLTVDVEHLLSCLPVEQVPAGGDLSGRRHYRLDQMASSEIANNYSQSLTNEPFANSRESMPRAADSTASPGGHGTMPEPIATIPQQPGWRGNQSGLEQEQMPSKGQRELATRNRVVQAYAADSQRRSRGGGMGPRDVNQKVVSPSDLASATSVFEGVSRALWVGDKLLLARRTRIGNRVVVQGSWLDWPGIKQLLLGQIADLVPQADLIPVTEQTPVSQFRPGRALAALPVQMVVPEPVLAGMPWSPVRVSLVAVWSCLTLAAAAMGLLLWGVLQLSERRAAFVAAVTHELRTPLTTFRMYSEMLAEDMVTHPNQRREYLQTLRAESERLTHLVENVLSYARLERGRPVGTKDTTTAEKILDRCQPRLAARASLAGMELVMEEDAVAKRAVLHTDPAAVEQVLFNLVDNASKYASGGHDRRIHLRLKSRNGGVMFCVADHGPGISPQAARDLFQPFSKSVEDAAQTAPGVGLGLALCHRLARDLGGQLQLKTSPQGGAEFELRLPQVA